MLGTEVVHVLRDIDVGTVGWQPQAQLGDGSSPPSPKPAALRLPPVDGGTSSGQIRTAFATIELPGKQRGETTAAEDNRRLPLNITVARMGDVCFVGLGGEILTEIGMAIKAGSPYKHTFVITHCNGSAGYLAPEHLYVEGGYEINSTRFAPQAAKMVVKKAIAMLHEL